MKDKFDDKDLVIFIQTLNGCTRLTLCTTSWWRRLLFSVGINCYYKEQEFVFKNLK